MANPIENKIIAQALTEINTIGKAIEKTFQGVAEQAKNIGDNAEDIVKNLDFKKSKDVEELNKQIQQLTKEVDNLTAANKTRKKASEEVTKQEKLLLKLQKDQTDTSKELAVEIEELRLERSKDTKAAKEQAKENKGLTNTLDKQRKRLNELQKELTNATLEGRQNEASVKAQKEEFEKLFTAITNAEQEFGNFRRQVGKYDEAAKDATRSTDKLVKAAKQIRNVGIAIASAGAASTLFRRSINNSSEELDEFEALSAGVEASFDKFIGTLGKAVITGESFSLDKLQNELDQTRESITEATERQIELTKQLQAPQGLSPLAATIGALSNLVDGFETGNEAIDEAIKKFSDFGESIVSDAEQGGISYQRLAKEIAEYEELAQKADQSTRGLNERLSDSRKAAIEVEDVFKLQNRQLEQQIKIAEQTAESVRGLGLRERKALEELSALEVQRTELFREQQAGRIESAERTNQLLQDIAEIDLDILIDQFDNIKAVNERVISDERETIETRKKLLKETEEQFDISVKAQIDTIQELQDELITVGEIEGERIDLQAEINRIKTLSIEQQAEELKNLGTSEIILTRVLEIIREQRTATQDLAEANRDLADSQREVNETLIDVGSQQDALDELAGLQLDNIEDFEELEIRRNEIFEQLAKDRVDNQIKSLQDEIEEQKKAGKETIQLQKQLNDLLLRRDQEIFNEKKKLNQEILEDDKRIAEERQELLNSFINGAEFVNDTLKTISDKNIANIDSEISAIERREDALRNALENGSELAGESLTKLDSERRALEDQRREEQEKQARREVFIAAARLVADTGSLAGAAQNIAGLKVIVDKVLSGFHDGGYTGDGGEWSTAGVVHKGEFVNTAKQVDNYGMKGWNASDFDKAVDSGYFNQFNSDLTSDYLKYDTVKPVVSSTLDTSKIVNRLERVEDAVLKTIERQPKHDKQWDEERKEMLYILETKNRIEKERRKSFKY